MAQQLDDTAKNAMLDALGVLVTRVALHTGDPGGANSATSEVAGGTYARKAITWNAAAGAVLDASNVPTFDVPAATSVTWVSFWNTAGTVRYGKRQLAAAETFGAAGQMELIDGTQLDLLLDP